jgi:hypothetical protein
MIDETDYCSDEILDELEALGMSVNEEYCDEDGNTIDTSRRKVLLYEAQKFLRKVKAMEVSVSANHPQDGPFYYEIWGEHVLLSDEERPYKSYEKALEEGIKESIILLKNDDGTL